MQADGLATVAPAPRLGTMACTLGVLAPLALAWPTAQDGPGSAAAVLVLLAAALLAAAHLLLGLSLRRPGARPMALAAGLVGALSCAVGAIGLILLGLDQVHDLPWPALVVRWVPRLALSLGLAPVYAVVGAALASDPPRLTGLWTGKLSLLAGAVYGLGASLQLLGLPRDAPPADRWEALVLLLCGLVIAGLMLAVSCQAMPDEDDEQVPPWWLELREVPDEEPPPQEPSAESSARRTESTSLGNKTGGLA